jgi:NAD(P)-dependent dehydrogenase (short-subunit alcohol dehydrogenase family)
MVSAIIVETMILDKGRRDIMADRDSMTSTGNLAATGHAAGADRAVVVGGSYGIGESVAAALARRGAEVLVAGRSRERLDAAVDRIRKAGQVIDGGEVTVEAHELDATDAAAVAGFFARVGPFGHLVLAASPGAVGLGPFASLDETALRRAFDGKFFAHFNVLKAAQARTSVTIITAMSARAAFPGASGLAAVNGALEAMVRPLAVELAPVRVNAVSPGVIDTPWWDGLPHDQRAGLFASVAAATPVKRVGRPEDVAEAVLYLTGSSFVTGTVLEVAGGANLTVGAVG